MKTLILLYMALIFTYSCEMMENAQKAAENSARAADNSDVLKDLSTSLYMSAVSGGSEDSRREAFQEMKKSDSFDLKSRYAASFIKSMTYQLINPMLKDVDVGDFERFFEDALLEDIPIVARAIAENMPKNGSLKITNTKGKNGDVKAIAVALHETNKLYYQFSGSEQIEMISMLDVIKEALQAYYVEGRTLDELTEVQKKVLYYRKEFLYALEIRHKFLPLIALAKISDLNSGTMKKIKMLIGKWEPERNEVVILQQPQDQQQQQEGNQKGEVVNTGFTSAEFEMALKVLKHSIDARDFLATLGTTDTALPGIVAKLLGNMDLKVDKDTEQVYVDINAAVETLLND